MAGKGLGTGLGALFGDAALEESGGEGTYLPLSKIEPRQDQPRSTFDEQSLSELSESIKEHGVIQPLTVRKLDGGYYQIIAGERRWRAARLAGIFEVPVRIIEADDKKAMVLAMVENLQREDLNPVEEATGYRYLMKEYGLTQEAVSESVGKSRPVVANALRILSLPEDALKYVESGKLSLSLARTILELEGDKKRSTAARIIAEKGLTVREALALVKKMASDDEIKKPDNESEIDYMKEIEMKLSRKMGRKVRIVDGHKKGRFEIEYYGTDDFEEMSRALERIGTVGK